MSVSSFAKLKNVSPWAIIAFAGLLLIFFAALGGLIQNYMVAEEFLIFSYADRLPHDQAWQTFFHRFGRPVEAIYWTYEYKLLGFNPLLSHVASLIQLLTLSILASACFLACWPQNKRTPELRYLLAFSFFVSWVSVSSVLRISYDNGRLALIFFFLAGLALQRWAANLRLRWLVLSLTLFLVSVFTYENAAFLFPALVLLALPILPAKQRASISFQAIAFFGLSVTSGLILLIPRLFYTYIAPPVATPALDFNFGDLLTRLLETAPLVYSNFGQFYGFQQPYLNLIIGLLLLVTLLLSTLTVFGLGVYNKSKIASDDQTRSMLIYLSSLWFLVFGPLPYVLLGYGIIGRVYSSAVFGVFPLLLIVYERYNKQWLRNAALVILFVLSSFGLLTLWSESRYFAQLESPLNTFYRGLKNVVPHVRANTTFILVNAPIGNQGCGPSLEMLYGVEDLACVVISSNADQGNIRRLGEFETAGLTLLDGNWIILVAIDNVPAVVDELTPGEYDLVIEWHSTEPMRTSSGRILTRNIPPASQFNSHLAERARALSSSE